MQAEFFQPQRQQHRREQRIAGHFAAHRQRLAARAGGADHGVQQAQHRWMQRAVKIAQRLIVAVGGEQVLHQIVGADGQEIGGADEGGQRDRRRRHFDHRAQRHVLGDGAAFPAEFALHIGHQGAHRDHFLAAADHRYQHTHRAVGAGAQDRAQLGAEQVDARQRQAHAAQAQGRVGFAGQREAAFIGLVRADIERADGDGAPGHAQHQIAIGAELLSFVGQRVPQFRRPVHEQEFGAVQPDPGRAQRMRFGHVFARFGVGPQFDVDAVQRPGGFAAQPMQLFPFARVQLYAAAVFAQIVGVRFQDDQTAAAVDRQHVAVVDLLQHVRRADHQRNVQAARQDRAVRQRAAARGDHRHHALRVQLREIRRCDGVGHQNVAGDSLQLGVTAVQRGVDAADHLVDVVDAAAQIGIVHAREHRGDAVALQAQRIVGGIAAGADQFVQSGQQFGVVQQQRVQIEELTDLVRQRAVQPVAQQVHFAAHHGDGGVQPVQFGIDQGGVDPLFGHVQRMRQTHARAPQRTAARCPLA